MWALPLLILYVLLMFAVFSSFDPTTYTLRHWGDGRQGGSALLCGKWGAGRHMLSSTFIRVKGHSQLVTRPPLTALCESAVAPSGEKRKPEMLGPPEPSFTVWGVKLCVCVPRPGAIWPDRCDASCLPIGPRRRKEGGWLLCLGW